MAADPNGFDQFRRAEPPVGLKGVSPLGFDHFRRGSPFRALVTLPKTIVLTQPSETDLAQPVTVLKTVTLTQPSETDLSQPLIHLKTKALTQPSETDSGIPVIARPIDEVIDGFNNANLSPFWTAEADPGVTVVEFSAAEPEFAFVEITHDGVTTEDATGSIVTATNYHLISSAMFVKLLQPDDNTGAVIYELAAREVGGANTAIVKVEGSLNVTGGSGTATAITYPLWLKLSESAGTLSYWYAENNAGVPGTWVLLDSVPTPAWMQSGVKAAVNTYTYGFLPQAFQIDQFNVLSGTQVVVLGQPSETDLAQPVTHVKTKTLGQASETDLAQPVAWAPKNRLAGQNTETDLAQPVTSLKTTAIGQASETDEAQPLTVPHIRLINQAAATDFAQPVTALKTVALGQLSETDLAHPVTAPKVFVLGQATETDLALTVSLVGPPPTVESLDYWRRSEVFGAQRGSVNTYGFEYWHRDEHGFLTSRNVAQVTQTEETDTAQTLALVSKSKTLGFPIEVATSGSSGYGGDWGADFGDVGSIGITVLKTAAIAQASETDLAQSITFVGGAKTRILGQASETDLAQALTVPHVRMVGQATETELAQPITAIKIKAIGQPSETDLAQIVTPLGGPKTRILGQASEDDLAQPITVIWRELIAVGHPDDSLIAVGNGNGVLVLTGSSNGSLSSPTATPGTLVLTPHPDGSL